MTEKMNMNMFLLESSLNTSDILAVVTSQAEQRLHDALSAVKTRLKEAEEEVKKANKEASERYKDEHLAACEAIAAKIRDAIESIGGKVKVMVRNDYQMRRLSEEGMLVAEVQVQSDSSGYNTATFCNKVKPSLTFIELEQRCVAAAESVKAIQQEALGIRKKISNIPMLERKARARLAEAKLSESSEGKAVLAALTSQFESDFIALPSN